MKDKEFKEWMNQYTDKSNFDDIDSKVCSNMLLFSMWEHRKEVIKKLEAENKKLRRCVKAGLKRKWVLGDSLTLMFTKCLKELDQ